VPAAPPPKRHPYDQWSPDARALDLVGDKWTLLIVRDLAAGPRRFVELQRGLPGISTEQLRSRLNRMVADGLLTRQRYREVPPRVDYDLTERSRDLLPTLGAIARWGRDWTWSAPRAGERVDVSAIFRLGAGLVVPAAGVSGTVELRIDEDGPVYTVMLGDGRAVVQQGPSESPAARISGTAEAWVNALAPDGDTSGLDITGEPTLAGTVLEGFGAPVQDADGRSAGGSVAAA
jgi:DNA-binding HxlR family transcriptional regulator